MNCKDEILDVSNIEFEGDFYNQIENLLSFIRLSKEEVEHMGDIYGDLENVLQEEWPGCRVKCFGSIVTGLGMKTSDADCFVEIRPGQDEYAVQSCKRTRRRLSMYPRLFTKLFAITQAKVPIVQFIHIPTQMNCDVSFSTPLGTINSELIALLLSTDKRVLPLAVIIKYWSKVHKLAGTNLLPNYSLILMIIFYLQQLEIVPSVRSLQSSVGEKIVDGWNVSFNTSRSYLHYSENNYPLHKLLGEFFVFYRDFKFEENIISTYTGVSYRRELFMKLETVPKEFSLYYHRVKKQDLPLKLDTAFCVQDPFCHNRNCTVAVFPRLAQTLKAFIKLAADTYENCAGNYDRLLEAWLVQKPANLPEPRVRPQRGNMKKGVANGRIAKNHLRGQRGQRHWNQRGRGRHRPSDNRTHRS